MTLLILITAIFFATSTVNANALKQDPYAYQNGFGNTISSEALPNSLPIGQNSPQKSNHGLYAEQLSGTSFTTPRTKNLNTWMYRIRPSVVHEPFKKKLYPNIERSYLNSAATPNQLRWKPFDIPKSKDRQQDFVDGLVSIAGAGDPALKVGLAIYVYTANTSMKDRCFCNSDGDFLIVPQQGPLNIQTEFGFIRVSPGEICVIPRGVKYSVFLVDGKARGYICEVFNGHFTLPELGPIGANGLAHPRDFQYPVAYYDNLEKDFKIVNKFQGELFEAISHHSPFDVVAFHGNYLPFKYDLSKFNTMNTVSYDHPDPSIYTVLTCPTNEPGVAAVDFVIFPPRWSVAENTFRPPYFHRNCMSEYMGLIKGVYEAKISGFQPGGGSLHSVMTPHGPDAATFEEWSTKELKPIFIQ